MTNTPSPIDELTAELARRSTGLERLAALHRLEKAGLDLTGVLSPLQLAVRVGAETDKAAARRALGTLVRLAAHDETSGLCALVILRPALLKLAGRFVAAGTERLEAETQVVSAAWESVAEVAERAEVGFDVDPYTAGRLVMWRTWSKCRRDWRRLEAWQHRAVLGPIPEVCDPTANPAGQIDTLLADAQRRHVLRPGDVELLRLTAVRDLSTHDVAAMLGTSPDCLRMRRQRAERRLADFVERTERQAVR